VMDLLVCLWDEANPRTLDAGKRQRHLMDHDLILSKGHSVPALYALAQVSGLLALENAAAGLRQLGSPLQGHPDTRFLPWLGTSSGSLGQGLSFACGLALGAKMSELSRKTFVILGDGELQEGQVWESFLFAAHHQLSNLVAVVDRNMLQSDSSTEDIMSLEPLSNKFVAFGWHVLEVDGHDVVEIRRSLEKAHLEKGRPSVIIANTVKGKGVSFMENEPAWHGSVAMSETEYRLALGEIAQGRR